MTQIAASGPSVVRYRIVAVMMAFSFMNHFNRTSMAVAGGERIIPELGVTEVQMGTVYSAFLLTYTLCMTPGGWVIDKLGPWRALLAVGLGTGLFGVATGFSGMLAGTAVAVVSALWLVRASMGVFSAPIYPACGAMAYRWFPPSSRAGTIGIVLGAAPFGIALSYPVFGRLVDLVGWPWAFVASGMVTAAVAVVWMVATKERPESHRDVNAEELAYIHSNDEEDRSSRDPEFTAPASKTLENRRRAWRSLALLTVSYASVGYFEYLFFYWMNYYFDTKLQLGKELSRYYASIPPLVMAIGMPIGGYLSDRLRKPLGVRGGLASVTVGGMLLGSIFLFIGVYATDPRWIVFWFALALGVMGACDTVCWAASIEIGGKHQGLAAGICNTGGNIGGFLAPILTPLIGSWLGWGWAIGLSSGLCLLGVLLWIEIDPTQRLDS